MPTFLDIKSAVANNLGRIDQATYDSKREGSINRARRKYYQEVGWNFLKKTVTLTFTSKLAPLPTDYSTKFDPVRVYDYSDNVEHTYVKVDLDRVNNYLEFDYVYAIDRENGKIVTNQDVATLKMIYIYLPLDITVTDSSKDNTVDPAPDTTAIEHLATALYFLGARQAAGKYQMFKDEYDKQLELDKRNNSTNDTVRLYRQPEDDKVDYGYQSKG